MKLMRRFRQAWRALNGHYDSAKTTPENRRHWQGNDGDKPITDVNTPETRRKLRGRCRYEHDNNSYFIGMVSTASADMLGATGPRLQVLSPDNSLNSLLEQEFNDWCHNDQVNLPGKLRILDETKLIEGECFMNIFTDEEVGEQTNYALNVNTVAPRRVANQDFIYGTQSVKSGLYNDDGVYVDLNTGKPRKYAVISAGDDIDGGLFSTKPKLIDSDYIIHWFVPKRPGQFRGIPEVQAAIDLYGKLRRFTNATLLSAEILASMTAFLKTDGPLADPEARPAIKDFSEFPIVRGMLNTLPDGWDVKFPEQVHPSSTYEMFVNLILREIGRVLNMPFGIVAGDSSKYNYSSARLDHRSYEDRVRFYRQQLIIRVLNKILVAWLFEARKSRPQVERMYETGELKWGWRFPSRPSIDPLKDANTDDIRLKNGSVTLAEVYADRGEDWETAIEQMAKEKERISAADLEDRFPFYFPVQKSNTGDAVN